MKSKRSIHVWPRKKLFPVSLDRVEAGILIYLQDGERTFTELCHYCINHGIGGDARIIGKAVKKMRRKKVILQKNQKLYPLLDRTGLAGVDVEQMVQRLSTGSGSLMVYNWMPPGGVSAMPRSGI